MHCIISSQQSCAAGHVCVDMNSGFRSNIPVFGGSDTDNSYDWHNGYGNFPETLLCQWRFWRNFSILAIQSSYMTRFMFTLAYVTVDCLCKCDPKLECLILSGTSFKTTLSLTSWDISNVYLKCDPGLNPAIMIMITMNE